MPARDLFGTTNDFCALIEDDEAAEADYSDARTTGRPNDYCFDGFKYVEWTDAPQDLSGLSAHRKQHFQKQIMYYATPFSFVKRCI